MRILLTGVTGYVGRRLLPVLIDLGHEVFCCVRDKKRFEIKSSIAEKVKVVEVDFLDPDSFGVLPETIDAAYYLIHSMAASTSSFYELESTCARNFSNYVSGTKAKQVIYLSGLIANKKKLSEHLASRKNVEDILVSGRYNTTVLRAGVIVGSGSGSFEMIRDIVEKLPIIVTPKWVLTKSQPISIHDIILYLSKVLLNDDCMYQAFDIGGPEVLTYKDMLLQYAEVRGLKRRIITVPFMTTKFSSYWLFFITSTSFRLATNLVQSLRHEVICKNKRLEEMLGITPITYKQAIENAFKQIKQNLVTSSWKDSVHDLNLSTTLSEFIEVPKYGCYVDRKSMHINDHQKVVDNIWSIGGDRGWYYANWLWKIRGFFDRLIGGVGLARGRKHPTQVHIGEAIDFWRVVYGDRVEKRLLLYAEMKLPGEAWLEFKIEKDKLYQTATFRPKGVWGRFYWGVTMPFHYFIFNGMINNIVHSPTLMSSKDL